MTNKTLGLNELLYEDVWVRQFMYEVYDMFGLPVSNDDCLNKAERILHVWGVMCLVEEMKRNEDWKAYKLCLEPQDAALKFVESYYNKTGKLLIENPAELETQAGITGVGNEV
jgi:hypothetical protein